MQIIPKLEDTRSDFTFFTRLLVDQKQDYKSAKIKFKKTKAVEKRHILLLKDVSSKPAGVYIPAAI